MSDGILEFGFEESNIIKKGAIDRFKISNANEKRAVSIIAFNPFHYSVLAMKTKEKGEPLTEEEKVALYKKVDAKLAENLKKKVEDLTEVDRLDIKSPRFVTSFTHYKDGIGNIRCLSKYQGTTLITPEVCCKEIGDADQVVSTIVLTYPTTKDGEVDMDLVKMRKMIDICTFKLNQRKFSTLNGIYSKSRQKDMPVIDLVLTLDGDPKFQKWVFENGFTAAWAREDADPEFRNWVLEQGLRSFKHAKGELGFEMKKEELLQKLGHSQGSDGNSGANAKPAISTSYSNLID